MANTLNSLIPDFFQALDVVSREMSGFLASITLDTSLERGAVGQLLRSPVTPTSTGEDIVPAVTPPASGDQIIGNEPLQIEKSRAFPFLWNGEQARALNNGGPGQLTIAQDQIAQAIRAAVNEMEVYIAAKAYIRASRAYGTAGTAPFATTVADLANMRKILVDNGSPPSGWKNVIDTNASTNLFSLSNLYKANEAGTDAFIRQAVIAELYGSMTRESAGIVKTVPGTANGAYVTNGGFAIGATTIAVQTGTGTIIPGDIITFAGDTNKYVVQTALTGGNVVINAPGLRKAVLTGVAVTVSGAYTPNMSFHPSAIVMGIRPPAEPPGGDLAVDKKIVVDPRSGIPFELRMYPGYYQMRYQLGVAYGGGNIKPNHSAILLG